MSSPSPLAASSVSGVRGRLADYVSLAKPRLNSLVLVTTGLGYLLAERSVDVWRLFHTLLGTALVAGGAAALNQVWERETDARMRRTASRPIPSGRLDVGGALVFGFAMSGAGLLELSFAVSRLAAALAAASLITYLLVYTPLKRVTSLSTVVGAIPGAIPPMIGWAAATGKLDPAAGVLFAILFFWQMPHFLAIAWLYREDYGRADFPMLPVIEPDGAATGRQAALYGLTLVPVSLALSGLHVTGGIYFVGALLCGIAFASCSLSFAIDRTNSRARALFFASIIYLPVLLTLAFLDKTT
jgi:protoheme IX farnesyltransferase